MDPGAYAAGAGLLCAVAILGQDRGSSLRRDPLRANVSPGAGARLVRDARVSPDNQWIAYSSSETGRFEVYVQAFPRGGRKLQITTDGSVGKFWSQTNRSLFVTNSLGLWEVRVDLQQGRVVDRRSVIDQTTRVDWRDVLRRDSVFVGATPALLPGESPRFVIVQGMVSEIRRRLAGQR